MKLRHGASIRQMSLGWLVGLAVGQLFGRSVSCLVGWLVGRSVCQFVGWLVGWSLCGNFVFGTFARYEAPAWGLYKAKFSDQSLRGGFQKKIPLSWS